MARFDISVRVMPRATLLDPQGRAVEVALGALGFADVDEVRVGKALTFRLEGADRDTAEAEARVMCEKLLANPVTEDFSIEIREA